MDAPTNAASDVANKKINWPLVGILVLALALRLIYLGWAQGNALSYQTDGVEAYEVAVHYTAGDERAQYIGQPNCNAHSKLPGPLWTLFGVAGLKLTGSMSGVMWLTIFANVVAIGLTWRLTRDWFGPRAANLAALFMATSPWAVFYATIVWNPSLMPLFGALIFLALAQNLRTEKSRLIFLIPFLILISPQFHMSPLTLILPLIAYAWLAKVKVNWRWLICGLVSGIACYLPYFHGEMQHHWANTRGILFGGEGHFSADALKIFSSPFSFLVNFWNPGWTYAPGDYQALARHTFGSTAGLIMANVISVIFAAILLIALIQLAITTVKQFRSSPRLAFFRAPGLALPGFLLATYLLFNLIAGKPFHARYCLLVLPLIFALAGAAAAQGFTHPRLRKLLLPALVLTIAANLWFVSTMSWFERDRIAHSPVFVPSFAKLESVYQELRKNSNVPIRVSDTAYLATLKEADKIHQWASLIRRYVNARLVELPLANVATQPVKVFELRAASTVNPSDPTLGFYGNGLALVALP
jgi:hypothetical protein